jgi:hypothetical protein
MKKLFISFFLVPALSLSAEIQFVNGSSDNGYLLVQQGVPAGGFQDVVTLAPGQSFRFQPSDGYTNGLFNLVVEHSDGGTVGTNLTIYDGDVVSLGFSDNVEQHSGLLDNATTRDEALCGYFTMGLESGSGLAAILLGFIAVRRALQMGEQWD